MPRTYTRRDPEERFWEKVDKSGHCWEWRGAKSRGGYGNFHADGRCVRAHRFAYESLVGPITEGLDLDHLCRNPGCVNPAHLEPVTRRVNTLRGDTLPAREILVTHCPHGHPYDTANTRTYRGMRFCRECHRITNRRWHRRRKENRS